MIRRPVSDSENIAPHSSLPSRLNSSKSASSSRNPLTPRNPLSKPGSKTPRTLKPSIQSANSAPTPSATRPRRRPALGDITNKANSNHAHPPVSIPSRFKSASQSRPSNPRPAPMDHFGNIETPHIIPQMTPPVYHPPMLFDQDDLTQIPRHKDTHRNMSALVDEEEAWNRLLAGDSTVEKLVLEEDDQHDHQLSSTLGLHLGGPIRLDEMLPVGQLVLDEGTSE